MRRLERLSASVGTLGKGADAAELVAAAARDALEGEAAVLATTSAAGELETLVLVDYPDRHIAEAIPSPLDPNIPLGHALRTGEPLFLESREALLARFPITPPARLHHGAWMVLPLRAGDQRRGALVVAFREARAFTETDRALAATVASVCANALDRVAAAARLANETEARRRAQVDSERMNLTLQERVEEFQTLLDVMPTGIAIAHDPDCRSITTNQWLSERLGVDTGRNISKSEPGNELPYVILRDGRECPSEELPMQKAAATGKPVREVECEVVRADGSRIVLLVSAAPVFDDQGNVRGCLGAFADVTQRREHERTLAEREARWRRILESMPVMLNAFRGGTFAFWNKECERVTGYSADEVVDNPRAMELLYPDPGYRERLLQAWHETGDTYREREWEVTCKDGAVRTVAWSSLSREFPIEGWSSWDVGIDVTQRRRVERDLRASRERFELVSHATNDTIRDWDLRTDTLWWSEHFQRVLAHTQPDPAVEGWSGRIHPEDQERVLASVHAAITQGHARWSDEYRFRRGDGTYADILDRGVISRDENGAAVRMISTMLDMTERKRAERELRHNEARFELIARATSEVLWDWNLETDESWWNANFATIFGVADPDHEPSVASWKARIHPDDREHVLGSIQRALRGTADYWSQEYRFQRADGTYATVLDRGCVLRDEKERAVRMVGSMVDISERVRQDRAAALQRETLARQERLSALGTLVSGVAHEVRTPLAYINNHAHIMGMRMARAGDEPARELAQRLAPATEAIVEGVERIDRLVQDLRRFLRPEPVERALTDLDESLQEAARMFQATHRADVSLRLDLASRAILPLDKVEVQQVVLNLLENAADASPSGGTVTLSTTRHPQGVRLTVEDEGRGMPDEVRLHMFDPFFTTKEEGTGLGLSIVHRIVESHGGTIECESRQGKGTRFTIVLPYARDA